MFHVDEDITINCAPETVFALVTNSSTTSQWQKSIIEERQTSNGPMGVGTTGINVRKAMGQEIKSTWEVTAYKASELFALKSTSGPVAFELSYRFQPVAGGTHLQVTFEGEMKGVLKLAEPMAAKGMKQDFAENLKQLKALLESRG